MGGPGEMILGAVRYDGMAVEIDTSTIDDAQGLLVFELINSDADTFTEIQVEPVEVVEDPDGLPRPVLPRRVNLAPVGGEIDLSSLTENTNLSLKVNNIRFDEVSSRYTADFRIENVGTTPIGRQVVAVFSDLPTEVLLATSSGMSPDASPYINFSEAIPGGGLAPDAESDPIQVSFDNPDLARFRLTPVLLSGPGNRAPTIEPIGPLTAMPGDFLAIPLPVFDADGDPLTITFTGDNLPTGTLESDNTLVFRPTPEQVGTYEFSIVASDGAVETVQPVSLLVIADPLTTTRVSGIVLDTLSQPIAGIDVNIGSLTTTTAADGTFQLETVGPLPSDTIDFHGETFSGPQAFPFVAEKLTLMLNRAVFEGAKNVIGRPVYLPALDIANGTMIDPTVAVDVTTPAIPGLMLEIAADNLRDQQGQPFNGLLTITQVPTNLTPAALPKNLRPDLVVTIQPGEMVFNTPAPLDFPNTAGYEPGTVLDLWSINPDTGEFDDVGDMVVSADGSTIETISGGVVNSSWHFPAPPAGPMNPDDEGNEGDDCDECKATGPGTSRIQLHSGAYLEDHALVTYQSLGQTRGFGLHYDSMRADIRPLAFFGYNNVTPTANRRIIASIEVRFGNFTYQVPGYSGNDFGLQGGEHIWNVPATFGPVRGSLQFDMSDAPTGLYEYDLTTGILNFNGTTFTGSTSTATKQLKIVNFSDSPFGSGWGLTG